MTALLDTDVLIDVLRGVKEAQAWLQSHANQALIVPGIVAMELLVGCKNRIEIQGCRAFLSQFPVAWTEAHEFERACEYLAAYRLQSGIGIPDCLIAAMATTRQATLYTFNVRHFRVIADLDIQQPYARPGNE